VSPVPNNCLQAALYYSEKLHWSVIPLSPNTKIPPKGFEVIPFRERIASREEISSWWRENPRYNVGIVTGKLSKILAIDHDKYKPEYSEERALEYIPDSIVTPTSSTPRGGLHQLFSFPEIKISIGTEIIPGLDYRGEGGYIVAPPSMSSNGGSYQWLVTPEEVQPATVPDALLNIISLNTYRESTQRPQDATEDHKMFSDGRRDVDLFSVGNALVKGGMPSWKIAQVLEHLIISWGEEPDQKWIEAKIKSALQRAERRERNIMSEVREWVETTNGYFETTTNHKELQLTTKEEMKAANMALLRLCEGPDAILEKHGDRRGCYRRIDRTIEFMDFANADLENTVDLHLPLGLHKKTNIFPKGAIVIAGVSGMGKTLFGLNAIAENMGRFPCFYFNSEMGPEALKKKLSHFPIPISNWASHMRVIDNWDFNNIPDKIQPDAFNVIDYLEPEGDRPYNIHGVISAIIRRLNKGTALIAIQKKPDARMGTGGIYSIKAATLALALDWGKIEIVKNRFREADKNPSLTKINFEVHQGYKFEKQGNWYR
jgi:hypothetical protein